MVMNKLRKQFGGSIARVKVRPSDTRFKNGKPYIKYLLTGSKLLIFLKFIEPFLQLKYKQARNLIKLLSTDVKWRNNFKPRPKSISRYFEKLRLNNRLLNTKNKPNKESVYA